MTTSHSDSIRIFYLLLSVILRNIWTLLKAVRTEKGMGEMRAYEFSEELKKEVFTAYTSLPDMPFAMIRETVHDCIMQETDG